MLGFVISAVVTTGIGLAATVVTTVVTTVTSVVLNLTMTTAHIGYGYLRGKCSLLGADTRAAPLELPSPLPPLPPLPRSDLIKDGPV